MLRPATRTGRCTVALWQFLTLTVLIGALLVYARIIDRRLARADSRLNRIEDDLLLKSRSIDSADARAAKAKDGVSGDQQRRGGYLTMRDLRRLSSSGTCSSIQSSISDSEARDTLKATRGLRSSSGAVPQRRGSVAISADSGEALTACGDQLSSHAARPLTNNAIPTRLERLDAPPTARDPLNLTIEALSGDSAATTLGSHDAPRENRGWHGPHGCGPTGDDSVARKNRDMALFLSNQRRRRRARLGY
jgi:hypothetical protein